MYTQAHQRITTVPCCCSRRRHNILRRSTSPWLQAEVLPVVCFPCLPTHGHVVVVLSLRLARSLFCVLIAMSSRDPFRLFPHPSRMLLLPLLEAVPPLSPSPLRLLLKAQPSSTFCLFIFTKLLYQRSPHLVSC